MKVKDIIYNISVFGSKLDMNKNKNNFLIFEKFTNYSVSTDAILEISHSPLPALTHAHAHM